MRIFNPFPTIAGMGAGSCGGGVGPYVSEYLIYQNFENSRSTGYDNGESWSVSKAGGDGVINSKYAPGLRGSQALYLSCGTTGTNTYVYSPVFANHDVIYIRFLFKVVAWQPSGTAYIFDLRNSIRDTSLMRIKLYDSKIMALEDDIGSAAITSLILDTGQTYTVWAEYHKGTGTNQLSKLWCSKDLFIPALGGAQLSSGTSTLQAGSAALKVSNPGGRITAIFDQIIISSFEITPSGEYSANQFTSSGACHASSYWQTSYPANARYGTGLFWMPNCIEDSTRLWYYDLGAGYSHAITRVVFGSPFEGGHSNLKTWEIWGSNVSDFSTKTVLASGVHADENTEVDSSFSNTTAYRYIGICAIDAYSTNWPALMNVRAGYTY